MIIQCNSCEKSFVVPDSAITAKGRLVQCNSCGNKWTQYPIKKEQDQINEVQSKPKKKEMEQEKVIKFRPSKKKKNSKRKKKKDLNPYSNEYLKKKHGIELINPSNESTLDNKSKRNFKTGLGFYNYLLITIIFLITLLGALNLTSEIIIYKFPFLEIYINHLFETLYNFRLIILDIISNY